MRRPVLAVLLLGGVVFGYGSALAHLVHGHGSHRFGGGHGCPHAAEAPAP